MPRKRAARGSPAADRHQRAARLKAAIALTGLRQWQIADRARMTDVRLSLILNSRSTPTPVEQRRLARALKCEIADLFAGDPALDQVAG